MPPGRADPLNEFGRLAWRSHSATSRYRGDFLSVASPRLAQVTEPTFSAPDDTPLAELTREQLLALLEAQHQAGIRIQFPGKDIARQLARKVRPRVTRAVDKYGTGNHEHQARNLVVEGDNLQTMATLYGYRGQVDLIVTDPPHNTGNDWRYNDKWDSNPNDPGLGDWVGGEDIGRHTKWMKFMYPRLQLMRGMLRPSGVLAICIDHRELFRLGQMLDEVFGERNRLAIINWRKASALKNTSSHVSTSTEYVLVYARDFETATTNSLERSASQTSRYSNPDDDPRGDWREGMLAAREWRPKNFYGIQSPLTGEMHYPPGNSRWRHQRKDIIGWLEQWGSKYEERTIGDGYAPALVLKAGFTRKAQENAESVLQSKNWPYIWFGRDGRGKPRKKIYLAEVKAGRVPETFWYSDDLSLDEASADVLGSTSWANDESVVRAMGQRN